MEVKLGRFAGVARDRGARLFLLLLAAAWGSVAVAQTPGAGVFTEVQTPRILQPSALLEPGTLRSRTVRVDVAGLSAARLGRGTLKLNLFQDVVVEARIDRVRPTRSGYFLSGRPVGADFGEVRLVVNGPVVVGTVVTPEGRFTIRWGGAGRHLVREVDPAADGIECELPEPAPQQPPSIQAPSPDASTRAGSVPARPEDVPTEDGSEIRMLVVYTPARQLSEGGAAGMRAVVDLYMESANQAFEEGGITPRLVFAHSSLVDYAEVSTTTDVNRLKNPFDGHMDEVHALRNEYAADLVHLLTTHQLRSPYGTASGILWNESLAQADDVSFAVTARYEDTFTHEIGHNFGLHHNRWYSTPDSYGIYPYAYGYRNQRAFEPGALESAGWRTLMATDGHCRDLSFQCPRLLRFSNPDQTHLGDPLGVPASDPTMGIHGPADARLTINNTARWVGSFRSESCTEFTILPPIASMEGGEVAVSVETAPGCLWEVTGQSDFFDVASGTRFAGSGAVTIRVQPNASGEERSGTLMVAGQPVTLRQLAVDQGVCGRTSRLMQKIVEEAGFSEPGQCSEVTSAHLSRITRLDLTDRGIESLKAGDFEGMSQLRSLQLSRNQLTGLPDGLFDGLASLEYLYLRENRLKVIPQDLFSGLSALQGVYLNNNQLTNLPQGLFSQLSNLKFLHLGHNKLESLDEGAFRGLSGLLGLDLQHNELSRLSTGTFDGLDSLTSLRLYENRLKEIQQGAFNGLSRLTILQLFSNDLADLPNGVFAGLSSLETLSLQENRLNQLPADAFSGMGSLGNLDLHLNNITLLPAGVFSDLTSLTTLRLDLNELASLPNSAFVGLPNLEILKLEENELTQLPEGIFAGLSSLRELSLYANELSELQRDLFKGLTELESLSLTNNRLLEVPDGLFDGLTNLQRLSLGDNDLRYLPEGLLEDLSSLQVLQLDSNRLTEIPVEMLKGLSSLRELRLQHNRISTLTAEVFSDLTALEHLRLDSNNLAALPEELFSGLSRIERLDFQWNSIHPLPVPISLQMLDGGQLKAVAPTGAPFPLEVSFTITGPAVAADRAGTLTIVTGETESEPVSVSKDAEEGGALWANIEALPQLPIGHLGYAFEVDESLPLLVLQASPSTDTSLADLSVAEGSLNFVFSGQRTEYRAIVANEVTQATVSPVPTVDGAEIAYLDAGGGAVVDADKVMAGHQVHVNVGENRVDVQVTSENGTATQVYRLRVIRDGEAQVCVRTEQVREKILEYLDNRLACFQVTEADLSGVSRLNFDGAGISSLKSGDFAGMTRLRQLNLHGSELSSLPAGIFSELGELQRLDLAANHLVELPLEVFSNLAQLEDLYLYGNRLTELPVGMFSDLSSLKDLLLSNNFLTSLEPGVFAGLSGLEHLSLGDNQLEELQQGVLSGLTGLERILLAENRLTSLQADVFSGLTALKEVDLRLNRLANLEGRLFSELTTLESIVLSDNGVGTLPIDAFLGLSRLKSLHLGGNALTSLPESVFANLASLQILSLAGNRLTELAPSSFSALTGLSSLYLSYNQLTSFPAGLLFGLTNLEILDTSFNSVDPLPLPIWLEKLGDSQFRAVAPVGAPFEIELPVSASGAGAIAGGREFARIPVGAVESAPLSVVRVAGTTEAVTVGLGVLPLLPERHAGYELHIVGELPIEIPSPRVVEPAGRVAGVEVVAVLDGLRVSWTAVQDADGYRVQWRSGEQGFEDAGTDGREASLSSGAEIEYTITGLTSSTEYRVRVITTKSGADDGEPSEEVAGTPLAGDADVNGDGSVDADDALTMYYAYRYADLVGNGQGGGVARHRRALLLAPSGVAAASDATFNEMLRKANEWRVVSAGAGGDLNDDGAVDWDDALTMYYAYSYGHLVGDGEIGGTAQSRRRLLLGLSGMQDADDAFLKGMLSRANRLRTSAD